jgi:LysM repeat protein
MFIKHKVKEGNVEQLLKSRHWSIVLGLFLMVALVACVRPLQDEETPTPVAPEETAPETQPETVPPTSAPVEQPEQPEQPAPETGEQPDQGGGAPTQPEGGTETTAPETGQPPAETTQPETGAPTTEQPPDQGQAVQPGVEQVHVVQQGENLFRIGLRYGCPYQTLAAYNGIPNPHYIYLGQQIRIPANCAAN